MPSGSPTDCGILLANWLNLSLTLSGLIPLDAIRVMQRATTTIPIIVGVSRNLVELGIVSSLAHPGGNITGMDLRDSEIIGKRLELMKEAVPKASRVAVLVDPMILATRLFQGTWKRRLVRFECNCSGSRREVPKLSSNYSSPWRKIMLTR
jgi:ABC transporter substrate binding protein